MWGVPGCVRVGGGCVPGHTVAAVAGLQGGCTALREQGELGFDKCIFTRFHVFCVDFPVF